MIIRMEHSEHGAMHVYLDAEAVENEKNGWVRVADKPVRKAVPVAAVAAVAPNATPIVADETVEAPFRRRPGRLSRKDTESML